MNVGINGFGRIGRNFLRAVLQGNDHAVSVVAINLGPSVEKKAAAHLFKYDTILGTYAGTVECDEDTLVVDGMSIRLFNCVEPSAIPWDKCGVRWVVEATGLFTAREAAVGHCVPHVLISAPSPDADVTIIPGINHDLFDETNHAVVSLGSCTTNALAPTLSVLHERFGIERAFMTTVHAYTNGQALLDSPGKDLRRARAAAMNMIPTSTGATKLIGTVIPELAGRVEGVAVRVPVADVSLIDVVVQCKKNIDVDSVNESVKQASAQQLRGIMGVSETPLVSSDYVGNSNSVTIDSALTQVNDSMLKVFGWYDNEWGYSCRLRDFLQKVEAR